MTVSSMEFLTIIGKNSNVSYERQCVIDLLRT